MLLLLLLLLLLPPFYESVCAAFTVLLLPGDPASERPTGPPGSSVYVYIGYVLHVHTRWLISDIPLMILYVCVYATVNAGAHRP